MDIGQKLKEKRTQAGLTQEAVAEKIGVSRQTVSNWENNRSYPDIVSILRLSDLYEVSLDEFLKEDANMRKHVEENAQTLKKIWNVLYDLSILLIPVAIFMQHYNWDTTATALYIISAVLFIVPRLLAPKLFGSNWKSELILIALYLLLLMNLFFLMAGRFGTIFLLITDILWLAFWGFHKQNSNTDTIHSSHWTLMALVIVLPMLMYVADSDNPTPVDEPNPYAPYPNTYQVAEVISPQNSEETLPLISLSEVRQTYKQDPLTTITEYTGHLSLLNPVTQESTYIGELTELEVPAGNSAPKGIWQTTPEEDSSLLYQVTVEADTSVTLSCYQGDSLQWKYLLEDMPHLKVGFSATANLMSWGERGNFHAVWYFGGTGYDHDTLKTVPETLGERTISFHPEFPAETLTVYEDYYCDGKMTTRELTIQPDENGIFQMKAVPYDDSGTRYCIYRVPFKDGEYIFRVDFP